MLAKHALSQLSYGPEPGKPLMVWREKMVGLGRLELPTSRLSSARSNQLSYKPGHCKTARFLARSALRLRHMRKPKAGSSFVEERETKTAASRKIGLTGRMFQVFQ